MLKKLMVLGVIALVCADENLEKFKTGNRNFSANVYTQVVKQSRNKNFLVCPLSAETILSLAQNGAFGKTRSEIRKVLNLPNSTHEINQIFKHLLKDLTKSEDYTLRTANKIYIQENIPINENFKSVAKNIYQSSAENIDFAQSQQAATIINDWVSDQTENLIHDLINPETLSEDTVAVLVNALYFQAHWRKNFKKTLTHKRDFFKNDDEVIHDVETMKKGDFYGYFESDDLDAKILQIPFRSRNASMVIALPNLVEGLAALERRIKDVFTAKFTWDFVELYLPKFKIETSIDFKKVLKSLGVRKAFTRADFSGMAGDRGQIHISDVVQKAYIKVNEEGVEASAATAVLYHPKSLMDVIGEKKMFIADHPFLFYIEVNDVVVFTGRVVTPSL